MRIKLDENLPLALQSGLGDLDHDVHSVFDGNLAGEPDDKIWHACAVEERFLITQDLDFSDARKYPPGTHAGIMILPQSSPVPTCGSNSNQPLILL